MTRQATGGAFRGVIRRGADRGLLRGVTRGSVERGGPAMFPLLWVGINAIVVSWLLDEWRSLLWRVVRRGAGRRGTTR